METKSLQNRNESIVAEEKAAQVEVSSKPKASFVQNLDVPVRGAGKSGSNNGDKAEGNVAISSSKKEETTFQSVPLRATSGGAYIYRDGTVEFGMGGEAILLPDGQTVSCTLSYRGFPSVTAKNTVLTEGKWYYEAMLLTDGLMQIGWCDTKFTGNSNDGEGVGDDEHSIAYDGKRKLKWHNGRSHPFGKRWKAGDVVCCAANLDDGEVKFALNGKWDDGSSAFSSLIFHDGLMPAASFSKGEKLCFNFGSTGNGFVHSPPDEEYLPVYIAQGNVDTMTKMEGFRKTKPQDSAIKSSSFSSNDLRRVEPTKGWRFSIIYGSAEQKHLLSNLQENKWLTRNCGITGDNHGFRRVESLASYQEEVEKMYGTKIVWEFVQLWDTHRLYANVPGYVFLIKNGDDDILSNAIPPEGLFRAMLNVPVNDPSLSPVKTKERSAGKSSNAYSYSHYPPAPPGFWGRKHSSWRTLRPNHQAAYNNWGNTWCRRGNRNNRSWGKSGCPSKSHRGRCGWAANGRDANCTKNSGTTATETGSESPVATFGKMVSNVLNATGGQAMKWVGEMCEEPNEKKFASDLQKAITQSLQEAPLPTSIGAENHNNRGDQLSKGGAKVTTRGSKKKASATIIADHTANNILRPRAKFVEQFAVSADTAGEKHVSLSALLPGEKITHVWRMINPSESYPWPKDVVAKSVGGDDFVIQTKEWTPSSIVDSKTTTDIVVEAVAPEKPGRYIHYWRLHDANNQPFGDRIWLDMTVVLRKPKEAQPLSAVAHLSTDKKVVASPQGLSVVKENDSNAAIITEPLGQDVKQPAEDTVKIGDTNIRKGAREGLLLPETENNCAIHTEEHEVHEESNKNEKGVLTEVEGVEKEDIVKDQNIPNLVKLDLDASSNASTSTSISNADEQWDLLHTSSFTEDFTTSSEDIAQIQKYKDQLDILSSMGFSNRGDLLKLLEKHNGNVQKVVDSFISSK